MCIRKNTSTLLLFLSNTMRKRIITLVLIIIGTVSQLLYGDQIQLHEISRLELDQKQQVLIIPNFVEYIQFIENGKKILLLHPKQEGEYLLILFYYDEQKKEIQIETKPLEVIKGPKPPEPEPNPNQDIAIQIKEGFKRTINNKNIAQTMVSTIDAVLRLAEQKGYTDPRTLRETMRYNMRLFLKNNYDFVNSSFDEPIVVPLIEKLHNDGKLQTIDDYKNLFLKIKEGLQEYINE